MSLKQIPSDHHVEDIKVNEDVIHSEGNDRKDKQLSEAIAAETADHSEGFIAALVTHKIAVFWSIIVSMCIIMEAYDIALVSNLVAQPAFREQFGVYVDDASGYQISPPWQSSILQAPIIGAFFGVLICGATASRFGYKRTLLGALVFMIGSIFLTFFGHSMPVLLVGQLLSGLPWGGFAIIGPAYASEVAPIALRGFLTIYVQLCWCAGQFIASGVCYAVRNNTTQWAYRIPFAIQWVWPVPLVVILAFAPESPWWLVRNGRLPEAEKVIQRLGSGSDKTGEVLSYMIRTCEIEASQTAGASYMDCFKGTDLRRTIITCCIHAFANFSGLLLGNLGTYFFTVAGLSTDMSYAMGLGNTGLQFVGVMLSWLLIQKFGHRTLYLWGTGFNVIVLALIGILACLPHSEKISWALGVLVIIMAFQCGLTILPMTYAIMGETSSVRLRARTIGLSRDAYYVFAVTMGIINSYMLNPSAWNLIGKAAFVWCATAILVWVACYFGLPEMRRRSWRELDIMYHRKVPAREFSRTAIGVEENE